MKFDLHVHSKYSKDSFNKPEMILKTARKKGLDGVAITDHNTIKGGIVTEKLNRDKDFEVIVGSEVKTEYGDIIGLFLQEEIRSSVFDEVVDEIKGQDGLVVLAHPFRKGIVFPQMLLSKVDLIEVFNARSTVTLNMRALDLVKKSKKTVTSGSDSHLFFEIGKGRTIVPNDIKSDLVHGRTSVEGNESNYYLVHGSSLFIEVIKSVVDL